MKNNIALLFTTLLFFNNAFSQTLNKEEKVSDFNYLYTELEKSYPYFEVNKRMNNIDWLSKKNSFYHEQMSLSHDEVSAVLRSTTQPAIIFTEDQSVTICNVKFYEWLAKNIGVPQEEIGLSTLRVSFRRSYRVLLEKFEKHGNSLAREQVSILLPGYAMSVFVNLTILNKVHENQKTFMGFF